VPTRIGATRNALGHPRHRPRVVDRQVARRGGDGAGRIDAAGGGAARQHDHQVRADRGELAHHVAAGAVAERGQHHHRGDADGHRQRQQERAQRIAGGGAEGRSEDITRAHCCLAGR
jgi:hypothetical protein